jgi:hypothetical protein
MYRKLSFFCGCLRGVAGVALVSLSLASLISCKPAPPTKPADDEEDLVPPPAYSFTNQSFNHPLIPSHLLEDLSMETRLFVQSIVVPARKIEEFRENISQYVQLGSWLSTHDITFMGTQSSTLVLASNINLSLNQNKSVLLQYVPLIGPNEGYTINFTYNPFLPDRMEQQLADFPELTPTSGEEVAVFLVARLYHTTFKPLTPNFFYPLNLHTLEQSVTTMP